MKRSELIQRLHDSQSRLSAKDVELASRLLLETLGHALSSGKRIEIRGFGSFDLHLRPARWGRNPKTGEKVFVASKHVPHFKQGKNLHHRLNHSPKTSG